MKTIYLIALMALAAGWMARAQTNTPAVPRGQTQIDSDGADFDINARTAVYRGHVLVTDPQMQLRCALLTVDLPQAGKRLSHVVAETNVVIDFTDERNQTNHITSGMAIYDFHMQDGVTNETITLTGSPKIINAQGIQTADIIIWDRANGHYRFINPHMNISQTFNGAISRSNSPPAKTNFPPGTIQNIDRMIINPPQRPP